MTQTIKLRNSGTASNTPSSLVHGELAINYADGKIFYKNASNNIVEFSTSTGSFLPLSGGTLTGNLALGTNSLSAKSITLNASGSSNPQITFNNNDFSSFDWFFNQDDSGRLLATVINTGGAEMQLYSDGSDYTNATLHVGGSRVITANAGVAMSTGAIAASGNLSLGTNTISSGAIDSSGAITATTNIRAGSSTGDNVLLNHSGSIEITRANGAFLDFKTANAEDYDGRIIMDTSNNMTFHTRTGSAASAPAKFIIQNDGNVKVVNSNFYVNTGSLYVGTGDVNESIKLGHYSSSESQITGLVAGSTFGSLITGATNGHIVMALRDNDVGDSFSVISGSGNYMADSTFDKKVFSVRADGQAEFSGSVTADGLTVDGGTASPIINLSRSGTYSGITFSQTVTNVTGAGADLSTYSLNANTGYVWQTCDSGGTTAKALYIAPNKDISFYNDSANQGLFWDSSASSLGLGTTSVNAKLHVSDATAPTFRLSRTGTGQIWQQSIDSSGRFTLQEGASEGGTKYTRLQIDDTGEATFSGSVTASDEFRGEVVAYSANQDAPYMIAGTSGYTGATTNWNTFGFQHRMKSSSTGVSRVTIDTYSGEAFSIDNNKSAVFSGAVSAPNVDITGALFDSAVNRGLKFDSTSVKPSNGSGGDANNHVDLGTTSAKFKNLYLSGTISSGAITVSQSADLHNQFISTGGNSKLSIISPDSGDAWINLSGATNEMSIGYERTSSEFRVTNHDTLASNVRLAISSSGNVDIGTDSATSSAKVTIQAQGANGSDETALVLRNYSASPYTGYVTQEYEVGTVLMAEISARRVSSTNGELIFRTKQSGTITDALNIASNGDISFYDSAGSSQNLYWDSSTSRLGLGTTAPDRKLHVKDSNYRVAVFERTGSPNGYIVLKDPNTTQDVGIGATTNDLKFRSGNVDNMSLSSTGNLNIPNGGLMIGATTVPDTQITAYHANTNITPQIKLWASTSDNTGTQGSSIDFVGSADKTAVGSRIIATRTAAGAHMDLRFHTSRDTLALTLDSSQNATFSGAVSVGTVAQVFTSSDRGYFVAGTSDSSNQHLYLGSYHGSTLKQLTFSGSNNGLYPQTTASIDLGLTTHKFKNLNLSGTISSGAITSTGLTVTKASGDIATLEGSGTTADVQANLVFNPVYDVNARIVSAREGANLSSSLAFETGSDNTGNTTKRLNIGGNGDISFYEDTGTTPKLFWDASAETLAIGHTSPSSTYRLDVNGAVRSFGNAPSYTLREDDASTQTWLMASYGGTFAVRDTTVSGSAYPFQIEAATPTNTLYLNSSGNVGINSSNPTQYINTGNYFKPSTSGTAKFLTIDGGTNAANIMLQGNITGENPLGGIYWTSTNGQSDAHRQVAAIDVQIDDHSANSALDGGSLRFFTKPAGSGVQSPRMTLLANGNLIFGKTADDDSTAGIRMVSTGHTSIVRSGGNCLTLNRLSSDGSLLDFRKDTGSLVGSIGTVDADLLIHSTASNHAGLRLGNGYVGATDNAGQVTNGVADLGLSTVRWKDLYLSGTANANKYAHDGDSDTYFDFPAANQLSLVGGGAEIVRAYQIAGAYGVLKVNGSGSQTYPNFTFNGDDNTGMYRATTDTLAFTTGGTERLRINHLGTVMVGSSQPYRNFSVSFNSTETNTSSSSSGFGNNNVGNGLMINNINTTNNTYVPLDFKCGTNHVWGRIAYKATDMNDAFGQFEFITMDDGSAVNALTITPSGNGTFAGSVSAPSGNYTTSGTASLADGTNGLRIVREGGDGAGSLGNGITFAQRWWSNSTQNVRTGAIFGKKINGSGGYGGGLAFYSQPPSGADMVEALSIDSSQQVNIPQSLMVGSTTAPSATLEVGALSSGSTGNVIINHEGGVTPVLQVKARTNRAILAVQDNDTSGYISSENGIFSIGRNSGSNANNINIDANNNVGIGTVSPNYLVDVEGAGSTLFRLNSTSGSVNAQLSVPDTTSICDINFGDSGHTQRGQIRYRHNGDSLSFSTAQSEALRLDSSQNATFSGNVDINSGVLNLSLGNTSGVEGGEMCFKGVRDTNNNVLTDDVRVDNYNGSLRIFSGSTVRMSVAGDSVGILHNHLAMKNNNHIRLYNTANTAWAQIGFDQTNNVIEVQRGIASSSDDYYDLGRTGSRWKDLYLSGKVTAANIYNAAGSEVMDLSNADSTIINDPDNHSCLLLSGGDYDTNYYSNDTHYFRGRNPLDIHAIIDTTGIKSLGDYKVGSQTVIDASRNLTNIGTIASTAINTSSSGTVFSGFAKSASFYEALNAGNTDATATSPRFYSPASGTAAISAGGAERLRLSSSGATFAGTIDSGAITSSGNLETATRLKFTASLANSWGAPIIFRESAHLALSDYSGVKLGGFNGTSYGPRFHVNGNGNVDILEGDLRIGTTTVIDASRNLTNINNITAADTVLIGGTSAGDYGITLDGSPASNSTPSMQLVRDFSGTATMIRFVNISGSPFVGSITSTTSATAYNTSSDERLKENIVDAPSASEDIDAIQVRSFDWKVDSKHQKYGMVAQELLEVAPDAVTQGDTPDDMMAVDYSKLVPMLIKEIQSLRNRVAQLER